MRSEDTARYTRGGEDSDRRSGNRFGEDGCALYSCAFGIAISCIVIKWPRCHQLINREYLNHVSMRYIRPIGAKEILEVDELGVLADKGYFNSVEIKECELFLRVEGSSVREVLCF